MTKPEEKIQKTVTVARGHTVTMPHPTETRMVGPDPETGARRTVPVQQDFAPGEKVTLPEEEINRLRAHGCCE
jgi:hypothetical protein